MKRNIIISIGLLLFLFSGSLKAQDARGNAAPAAFLGDEEITIYLRVVGTELEDTEATLSFVSGANGGAMSMSMDATQSADDGNVWTVTLTPDIYYGVTVETIEGKITDNAGIETNVLSFIAFDPASMDGAMVSWYPEIALYSENMSLIFNSSLSDRDDLTGVEPIYLWTWNNPEALGDAANQGDWGSIDPSAECVKIGDNLWRKDFVPQEYWDTKKPMSEIGALFRNMGGDAQTDDFAVTLVGPPVNEVAAVIRPFPSKFTKEDVFTLYYDLKLETNAAMKDQTQVYLFTSTNVEEENNPLPGNWIVYSGTQLEVGKMTPMGDSIYSIQYIPEQYYSLDPEYNLKQLNFIFRNKGGVAKSEQYSIKVLKTD